MYHEMLLPVSGVALALVGLCSVPAALAIFSQVRAGAPRDNFYQDRDGKSTPEAVAAFSNTKPKIVSFIVSLAGLGTSIAVSTLETIHPPEHDLFLQNWLTTAAWVLIVLQTTILGAIHSSVKCYDLGILTFFSCIVIFVSDILQTYDASTHLNGQVDAASICRIVNFVVVLITGFTNVLLPRRPDVYFRDQVVDAQLTVSWLNRMSYTWVRPLMNLATEKGDLTEKDIPQVDHLNRAEEVVLDWNQADTKGRLLWAMIWVYKLRLALQWTVTIVRCLLGVGPFYIMLRLIENLEQRGGGGSPSRELWGLILALALFSLAEQWLDSWTNYYSIAMIGQPIRAQLSALIYQKSLRRKNVKAADPLKAVATPESGDAAQGPEAALAEDHAGVDGANASGAESSKKKEGDDEQAEGDGASVLKSRQAIVNLVGVDTKRIFQFAVMQFFLINSFGKLVFYSIFLVNLIGWIPFGCGLLAWCLVLPVNAACARVYVSCSGKLMNLRDEKLAVVNEALLGIRQIKFAALEDKWEQRIMKKRGAELKMTWTIFLSDIVLFGCWVTSPILLAATALASYALLNGDLSASVAFTSISVFKALEATLSFLPEIMTTAIDTVVSIDRIDTYLKGPELTKTVSEGHDVAFANASISWPVDDEVSDVNRFILRNLDLTFPQGELSVISGKTGTGKSLLLSALIGEADLVDGSIYLPSTVPPEERNDAKAHPGNWILPGSVAYVAQTPWLEGASLKDNILFGLPHLNDRYNTVLDVCALKKDLEILTDGDETMLGANGINLSGGQKWRVSLARAIYSRAEILIMDDIFSAVDAHVGRYIFDNCIGGDICKGRTRILVTHHVGLVQPLTKFLVELGDGVVAESGLTSDLIERGALERIKSHEQTASGVPQDESLGSSTAVQSEETSDAGSSNAQPSVEKPKKDAKAFTQEETREKGHVKRHVYSTYMADCGGWMMWITCAIIYTGFEAGNLSRGWWVRIWTGADSKASGFTEHRYGYASPYSQLTFQTAASRGDSLGAQTRGNEDLAYYLWIYIGLSVAMAVMGALRFWWSFSMSIKASRVLFNRILDNVMRTPLRWLDTVPVGRILNRMTSDFETIDQRLTMDLGMLFWHLLSLAGVCVAGLLVSPYILPLAVVLIAAASYVGKKYLDGVRPLKRLESTSKSPVFELFNVTLAGISTVRAFQKTQVYTDHMHKGLDVWDSVSLFMYNANRWLGFRMALVGTTFTTLMGIVVIMSPEVDAAMAGFTIAFALDFSGNMIMAIRNYSSLELDMNAAERVIEYSEVPIESQGGQKPPAAWPTSGRMEIEKLVVSYADDLPPVLKGVSFEVKDNERIGVVGRTGAGKSSLTLALFRFLEARSGSVYIDGLDISKLDLHSLRSRLAIIPQDPVLFSGTVRSNLDAFGDRTDDELKESLARVHLLDSSPNTPGEPATSGSATPDLAKNTNVFKDLDSPISESGGNLSQGQRQLLCLARAIVSRPRIMLLDEATSAVDMNTDHLIQRSIREEFTDSTLLVIAHRLSTVADFDRILVLSDGMAAEFGTPAELWNKEGSIFREMCESSGERTKLQETIFGTQ